LTANTVSPTLHFHEAAPVALVAPSPLPEPNPNANRLIVSVDGQKQIYDERLLAVSMPETRELK